ncbi:(d)CMP kinase [Lactobacillus xylocopicola]|nr:(d)CMP kinase [Lactobacillus xylocopicola]
MQVAIDGPASAGKSTVAKLIAQKLGFTYIDTGAMYRACTFLARSHGLDYGDEAGILALVEQTGIELRNIAGQQHVLVGTRDISHEIRKPEISAKVSQVAALSGVRQKMVSLQRQMAGKVDVVMDGRDIGTTVLPDAQVKIFLVASARSRAQRRMLDLEEQGIKTTKTVAEIEADIAARDYKDSHRAISPLKKAVDAVEIDTTSMTIAEVVNKILRQIKKSQKKLQKRG